MLSRTYYILYESAHGFITDLENQLAKGYYVLDNQKQPPSHCRVILCFVLRDSTQIMVSGKPYSEWDGAGACIGLDGGNQDEWTTFIEHAMTLAEDEWETVPPVISTTKPLFQHAHHDILSFEEKSDIFQTELTPKPRQRPRRLSQRLLEEKAEDSTDLELDG